MRPSADGSAPGIKVQLTSGVQHYFTFSDVVPYVFDKPEGISTENDKARYALALLQFSVPVDGFLRHNFLTGAHRELQLAADMRGTRAD